MCVNLPIHDYCGTKSLNCRVAPSCSWCVAELAFKFIIKVCVVKKNGINIWLWLFENFPVLCGYSGSSTFFLGRLPHHTFWLVIGQIFSIFFLYFKIECGLSCECLVYHSVIWAAPILPLAIVVLNWLQERQCIFLALKCATVLLDINGTGFGFFLLFLFLL